MINKRPLILTLIGAAMVMVAGASIAIWTLFLLLAGGRGPAPVVAIIFGLSTAVTGALILARAGKADKPLDKPPASRHLAGPGRIWRPR
jgi:predicted Co/Zn/Cd cation transporter (cation efflux family)